MKICIFVFLALIYLFLNDYEIQKQIEKYLNKNFKIIHSVYRQMQVCLNIYNFLIMILWHKNKN